MTVALYVRLSPRPDGQYEGCDRQEQWGRAYAERTWPSEAVRVFSDTGLSAFNGGPRPGYESLRDAISRGEVEHLWTVEQSRLERTEIGWFELCAELADAGIAEVHTDRDGTVRLDDAAGGIKAVLAAHEARRLRRRVNDALDSLAAQGRPGGATPFGYRNARNEQGEAALEIVPEHAEAIRWAADKALAGWSLSAIAREFQARELPTRYGGEWSHSNVKGMLTSPTVAGFRVHRGEIVGRGTWQPILDETTWRTLCARLPGPKHRPARSYLLSGLAVCGRCGHGLTGRIQGGRSGPRPILFCHPSTGGCGRLGINAEPVEQYVTEALFAGLDSPEFAAAMADDEHHAERDRIHWELEEIQQFRSDLARRVGKREMSPVEWADARAALEADEKQLRAELAAVPAPPAAVDLGSLRSDWSNMTMDERRTVLALFIERIEVAPAAPGARTVDVGRLHIMWK